MIEAIARAIAPHVPGSRKQATADRISQAALSAIEQEGFVVVPKEPTEAMLEAIGSRELGCRRDCTVGRHRAAGIWQAMIQAHRESISQEAARG